MFRLEDENMSSLVVFAACLPSVPSLHWGIQVHSIGKQNFFKASSFKCKCRLALASLSFWQEQLELRFCI